MRCFVEIYIYIEEYSTISQLYGIRTLHFGLGCVKRHTCRIHTLFVAVDDDDYYCYYFLPLARNKKPNERMEETRRTRRKGEKETLDAVDNVCATRRSCVLCDTIWNRFNTMPIPPRVPCYFAVHSAVRPCAFGCQCVSGSERVFVHRVIWMTINYCEIQNVVLSTNWRGALSVVSCHLKHWTRINFRICE